MIIYILKRAWSDFMYKFIITDLILAFIIGLIFIAFNGFSMSVFYIVVLFFIVLILRDNLVRKIKKRKRN